MSQKQYVLPQAQHTGTLRIAKPLGVIRDMIEFTQIKLKNKKNILIFVKIKIADGLHRSKR